MVTVAIPVLNGRRWLPAVLKAVASQQLDDDFEVLVCDSGSTDGSRDIARRAGARVIDLARTEFDHSRVRNLLMERAQGEYVAMITQDAEPADPRWLARLLGAFALGEDVALTYGPYVPRPDCPGREADRLRRFFMSISPSGQPRIDRLATWERGVSPRELIGPRGYFTDANGCIRREAWQRVPYPPAAYAEDHALALRMLVAGYAKVFVPAAGVLHSHHYTPVQGLRRSFDDWRGLLEVYGWREPAGLDHIGLQLRGAAGQAHRTLRAAGTPPLREPLPIMAAVAEHGLRLTGAILGSRADRLPGWVRRHLSLDGRDSFVPVSHAPPALAVPATEDQSRR